MCLSICLSANLTDQTDGIFDERGAPCISLSSLSLQSEPQIKKRATGNEAHRDYTIGLGRSFIRCSP